ncbi:nucleic-acid-binding protein from transposon X-element [Trichonephila clavipes]|nr:nucleic-acid-binding protein from transposon X-element [Trichonephila clavipes]
MATDQSNPMECQNIPLPNSRPGTPTDLFTNCERLNQVQSEIKKFTLLTIGARDSLNSLAPFMSIDDPNNIEDIQEDLLEQGFHDCKRLLQLIGRITKQSSQFYGYTPRNINNTKIFDLKYLSYLSIRVEGYEGKGVTQCYSCNRFNHTAQNCHMNPRCIKCGQAHQTKECPIKRVENTYCINCKTYGHMANYSKCPLYPKPRKGKHLKTITPQ